MQEIKEVMKHSRELGMQTFDQAVYDLYKSGIISYEDCLKNAGSSNEVRLMIKLSSETGELPDGDNLEDWTMQGDDIGVIGRM